MLLTDELVERTIEVYVGIPFAEFAENAPETALGACQRMHAALSIAAREITEACAKVALNYPLEAGRGNVRKSRLSYQEIQFQIASAIRALAREVA
jgi:hypothetical protein